MQIQNNLSFNNNNYSKCSKSNLNFTAIKSIQCQGLYTKAPEYGKELLEAFNKNPVAMDFCKKYDLYAEPATSWFYHFCPDKGEWEDWETDNYEVEEETYLIVGSNNLNCLPYIKAVAEFWFNLSKAYGDKGSCVLGAGFKFVYNNKKYN